uniref:Uncharacterized protein n=1 Tax=Ananas comosus var. bracteatus TaxID=296719 RepID=A0A6V7QMZ4_ANACO|nr:unnamed protein product [Ananas comosus var. bracteatus]
MQTIVGSDCQTFKAEEFCDIQRRGGHGVVLARLISFGLIILEREASRTNITHVFFIQTLSARKNLLWYASCCSASSSEKPVQQLLAVFVQKSRGCTLSLTAVHMLSSENTLVHLKS